MRYVLHKISTIVRISILTVGIVLAGCGTLVAPRATLTSQCAATQTLMCERFGPEERCTCGDHRRVSGNLAAFGQSFGFAPSVR